jgi:hypothetical protein
MGWQSEFFFSNIIYSVLLHRSDAHNVNYHFLGSSSSRLWTIFFSVCLSIYSSVSKNQCVFNCLARSTMGLLLVDMHSNALLLTFFQLCLQKHHIKIQFLVITKVYSSNPKVFQNFVNHFFPCILIDKSFYAWIFSIISYSTILIVSLIIIYWGATDLKPPFGD